MERYHIILYVFVILNSSAVMCEYNMIINLIFFPLRDIIIVGFIIAFAGINKSTRQALIAGPKLYFMPTAL